MRKVFVPGAPLGSSGGPWSPVTRWPPLWRPRCRPSLYRRQRSDYSPLGSQPAHIAKGVDMFKVIVVATDGSQAGDLAMSCAKDLAVENKSRLQVVYVDELIPGHGGAHHAQGMEPETKTRIAGQVSELQAAGLDARFEVHQVVIHGPAHAIADAAVGAGADLIVLGSVGSGPLKGLLLGSVAHRLLQIAPCPVLVVPHKDR